MHGTPLAALHRSHAEKEGTSRLLHQQTTGEFLVFHGARLLSLGHIPFLWNAFPWGCNIASVSFRQTYEEEYHRAIEAEGTSSEFLMSAFGVGLDRSASVSFDEKCTF